MGYNTYDFNIISAEYLNDNGQRYSLLTGGRADDGNGVIKVGNLVRVYTENSVVFGDKVYLWILHK